jgi:putative ABC transport system permease protein
VATVRDANQLQQMLEDYVGLFYVFIGLMLAFGGLLAFALLFNTMWANLSERSTELAMMRANGMSRRQLARMVLWENLLLVLLSLPIGLAAGYWVASALLASYTTDSWVFELHFAPMTYVWCAAAMIAITLCSLWPSLRAIEAQDIGAIVRQRSQ